jgi:hypothetical protein
VRAEVERRRAATRSAPRLLWLATPLAAAAATALVLWPADPPIDPAIDEPLPEPAIQTPSIPDPGTTRIKGLEPHLLVFRQEGESAVPLQEPAEAHPRDRLQLSYVAAGARTASSSPSTAPASSPSTTPPARPPPTTLQQGGAVPLDRSYELDAAPEFERFILVTADTPLHTATILAAAKQLAGSPQAATAPLVLPLELRQRSFLLRKVAP